MKKRRLPVLVSLLLAAAAVATGGTHAETDDGLFIRVLGLHGAPVYAAAVTLYSRSSDFDPLYAMTDAAGLAQFGSLPSSTGYRVLVDTLAGGPTGLETFLSAESDGVIDIRLEAAGAPVARPLMAGTALPALRASEISEVYRPAEAPHSSPIPRSGDAFSATLGVRFRSSVLDGSGAQPDAQLGNDSFRSSQPIARVSGAVAGGRAWYRLAYDVVRDDRPGALGHDIVIRRDRVSSLSPQIAWQVSPRNRLSLEYGRMSIQRDSLDVSSTLGRDSSAAIDADVDTATLRWVAPVSTTVLVEGSVSRREATDRVSPTRSGHINDCVAVSSSAAFMLGARCRNLRTQRTSGPYPLEIEGNTHGLVARSQFTLRDRRLWGVGHTLRAGLEVDNQRYAQAIESRPRVQQLVVRPVRDPDAAHVPEDIYLLAADLELQSASRASVRSVAWRVFVEDGIRPRDNLNLTLGAVLERSEHNGDGYSPFDPREERARFFQQLGAGMTPAQAFASGTFTAYEGMGRLREDLTAATGINFAPLANILNLQPAAWPSPRTRAGIELTSTNLSPYLTVDWSPWANGKSRVALSARRFHDNVSPRVLAVEQQPTTWNLQFSGQRERTRIRPDRIAVGPTGSARVVDHDLQPARHDEIIVTIEREVTPATRVRLQWVDRRHRDQLRSQDINQAPGDFGRCGEQLFTNLFNPLVESPGSGFELLDRGTGERYIDTDPGPGDGRLDDCRGNTGLTDQFYVPQLSGFQIPFELPDGRPDLYRQNPGWASVILIDNSGRSDYEALVLELIRRERNGWQLLGGYTWARHRGNYDRLAAFDALDPTLSDGAIRDQPDDRRHAVHLDATTRVGAYRLAGRATWESGLPYSILRQRLVYDVHPPAYTQQFGTASARNRLEYSGDRNRARNSGQYLFDVLATRTFTPRLGSSIEVAVAIQNVLNDGTYRVYDPSTGNGVQINGVGSARREFGRRFELGLTANW